MSATTQVITKAQARQITRGRTPLVPVEYEAAVKALSACDETLRKAKMLKLHAYRRMGELAGELKPLTNARGGHQPGALQVLKDLGLSQNSAIAARRLASISQLRFEKLMERPRAPSIILQDLWVRDEAWADFVRTATTFRSALRRHSPIAVGVACKANDRYVVTARELLTEITEWLDAFEQRLPKVSP